VFSTADDSQTAVTVHVMQGEREMATGNKSLGRFDLTGIPSAPRGVPQIEVTFDIDANGILHVSARDKATGKENKIVIKAGSGLTEEEIQRMVQDAEAHAEEDKKARELADARNQADAMVHGVRKSMKELGDKLEAAEKEKIEAAIKDLEAVMRGDDQEEIKGKTQALQEASHKLAEQLYAQASQADAASSQPADAEAEGAGAKGKGKDDVVDAEFEEVKENKKK
jgi:molecular chaperone DnaK